MSDGTQHAALETDLSLSPKPSALTLTTHASFSLTAKSLQKLIKPFRPRLVAPPRDPFPAGSPRITPIPEKLTRKCHVDEQTIEGVYTYALRPRSVRAKASPAKHHVYYFAGGGFQMPPSSDHWKMLAEMSKRLGHLGGATQLHLVSYPLAPSNPAADSLRILRLWLENVLSRASDEGSTIALAGDSSGGNIALTLAIAATGGWLGSFAQDENAAPGDGLPTSAVLADSDEKQSHSLTPLTMGKSSHVAALKHVLLLCPAADMRNGNPEIDEVNRVDPILTSNFTGTVAKIWCGTLDGTAHPSTLRSLTVRTAPGRSPQLKDTDPRVSPVLANLRGLSDHGVRVDGLIGGHDVLSPDAKVLVEKLQAAAVHGEWQIWTHMMHCWPLTWWAHVPESMEALDWMVRRLVVGAATSPSVPKADH